MTTTDYSRVVGVFRDQTSAARAIDELKRSNFQEDQIQLTEYSPSEESESEDSGVYHQETDRRIIVQVQAPGREQEVVGILVSYGSNNADVPPGTVLVDGAIVRPPDAQVTADIDPVL